MNRGTTNGLGECLRPGTPESLDPRDLCATIIDWVGTLLGGNAARRQFEDAQETVLGSHILRQGTTHMLCLANSRVFQTMAMFGLIVSRLAWIVHLSVPNESTVRADEARATTTEQIASPVASVPTFCSQQTRGRLRVSVLGITKGVAFLESQEPAIDGGRKRGNNAIARVRAAVVVERLGDEPAQLGGIDICFRTPDGEELVESHVVIGHGSRLAELDHYYWPRARDLFPTALTNVEKPSQSKVILAAESGRTRATRTATLLIRFGKHGAQEEFVFENVPMP